MAQERIELQPELTGIALAHRNESCIADKIFPVVQVDSLSFQYYKFAKGDFLTVPETKVGEKGEAQRIDIKADLKTDTVDEHALEEAVSVSRANQENQKINRYEVASLQLTDCLKLRREVDAAKLLSDTNNYDGNFKNITATEKITKDDSNAVKLIMNAMALCFKKPNKMILSRRAAYALRQNPFILQAVTKASISGGVASLAGIKELFELDEILVGESVANTAKNKETPNLSAAWSDDIILGYFDKNVTAKYGLSFGYKAQYEDIQIWQYFNGGIGSKGADILKATMAEKYMLTCPNCGYLLKGVV